MILLGKVGMGLLGTALAATGIICSEGMISVQVETKQPDEHHIFVVAPVVPMAMHFVPKDQLAEPAREIRPWLPTIRAGIDAMKEAEDIMFVEVTEPGQHVHIAKSGSSIVIDVDDHDGDE